MADIVSAPDDLCFSSRIGDVVFRTSDEYGIVVFGFRVGDVHTILLEERVYADASGIVRVSDLESYLAPFSRDLGVLHCYCWLNDSTPVFSAFTVIPGFADVGMSASDFVHRHFLTTLDGEKQTSYMRTEWLSGYGFDTVHVVAHVCNADNTIDMHECDLPADQSIDGISRFNVSVLRIADLLLLVNDRIVRYDVVNGDCMQRYVVLDDDVSPTVSILFVNSFGCEEFFHCTGSMERSTDFDRQRLRFGKMYRTTHIDESRKFEVSTGWLPDGMSEWALDFLRSRRLWLWEYGRCSHEIVITSSKDEWRNDDDSLTAYDVTYTYARDDQNMLPTVKPFRIFSDEFSEVFI